MTTTTSLETGIESRGATSATCEDCGNRIAIHPDHGTEFGHERGEPCFEAELGGDETLIDEPSGSVGTAAIRVIQSHADALAAIPSYPETFTARDIPPYAWRIVRKFDWTDGVRVVLEGVRSSDDVTWSVYQLHPDTTKRLREFRESRNAICPCGHAGVRNEGDYYSCSFDHCDREFGRGELEGSS